MRLPSLLFGYTVMYYSCRLASTRTNSSRFLRHFHSIQSVTSKPVELVAGNKLDYKDHRETEHSSVYFPELKSKYRIRMLSTNSIKLTNKIPNWNASLEENLSERLDCPRRRAPTLISREEPVDDHYSRTMLDLNLLQSNTQVIALAKYKSPEDILPLFTKQLNLAGIELKDLDKIKIIHISGTKGKGSTSAFLESILQASGKKTGFYNSPHLLKVTERIRVDGKPIDDTKFSKYFRQIFNRLVEGTQKANITMPSYFSFLTILSFHIFLQEKVDCAVIEVGIGGEYDPTNVIQHPIACGISTLDYDHMNILGNTIEKIAWAKSGIAKNTVPIFTVEQDQGEALDVIKSRAREKNCPVYICKPQVDQEARLGIRGPAQLDNAVLACQLADYFLKTTDSSNLPPVEAEDMILHTNISKFPNHFQEALANCSWPGRCQIIEYPKITFFLDGAHTRKSMNNCLSWFVSASGANQADVCRILMVNVIGERDRHNVLEPLTTYEDFDQVIFSTNKISSTRETPKSDMFVNMNCLTSEKSVENAHKNARIWEDLLVDRRRECSNIMILPSTYEAVRHVVQMSHRNPEKKYHVLVTGSLHFVGAILGTLPAVDELSD